ncbi:MAG: AbrB/MazE/SpoVT family DNA-binding domain-containing protein [Pseudolysinimonas sp.]
MPTATVTSKGQITIPLEIRNRFGIHAGTRVHFVVHDDNTIDFVPATRSIRDLAGILKYDGPPVSIEEMDATIAEAAARGMP